MRQKDEIVRVAAIQAAPVFLDRDGSLEKAVSLIRQASRKGACLAAFGESWLPGYPVHAWASASAPLWWDMAADYLDQSVEIPGPATDALCAAAREGGIDVVIGVSEKDTNTRGSAYSTVLLISRDGEILGRHRKLKPALYERVVWSDGDAIDLKVHERGYAGVSSLTGAEHQMVLPTYALAEQGTQIHVACWPGGELAATRPPATMWPRQHLLSRAFAAQTGAYVICAAGTLTRNAVPERYRDYLTVEHTGNSAIIDPRGEIVAGPVEPEGILTTDCSMALVRAAKVAFDCTGHSARRDQLRLWNQVTGGHDAAPEGGDEPGRDGGDSSGGDADEASGGVAPMAVAPLQRSSGV